MEQIALDEGRGPHYNSIPFPMKQPACRPIFLLSLGARTGDDQ
ncbi:MAG: hypothetical protein ACR2ID_08120 [Chthoniobacterales bacterium]